MDAEQTIAEIEYLERIYSAPDIRRLSPRDLAAANRRHDEMLAHSPWFRLWQRYGICCRSESPAIRLGDMGSSFPKEFEQSHFLRSATSRRQSIPALATSKNSQKTRRFRQYLRTVSLETERHALEYLRAATTGLQRSKRTLMAPKSQAADRYATNRLPTSSPRAKEQCSYGIAKRVAGPESTSNPDIRGKVNA
jgi:hypothetical protein